MSDLALHIRSIQDFPKPGIDFKDITPLFLDPQIMKEALDALLKPFEGKKIDKVVGIEARGFFFAPLMAQALGAGFVPIRKPGKLPFDTISESYDLEYGTNTVEIHTDAIKPGEIVLIHDDVLATGGTAAAACALIERLGGKVIAFSFIMELEFLNGKEKINKYLIHKLFAY